ncbi:gamma-mobile-trio protein GmtX [Acetobacterium malicum]|uniref:gamma-mobile-trio protein GmtX n=1 Tax=Acetobacterium malicum TaxID=52692 RepID=UPI003593C6C2
MIIHPNEFLSELCKNASVRKKNTLELINTVCKEHAESGNDDFSITTLSSIIAAKGGPCEQSLRNKAAKDYRALIKNWAEYTNGSNKKKGKTVTSSNINDEILSRITDPTVRALVGIKIAENHKLKNELTILKHQTVLTIDNRKSDKTLRNKGFNEIISVPTNRLNESEVEALRYAVSDEFMKNQNWTADKRGRVEKNGAQIFKPGFITAIRKILEEYE